jgi:hypothetical protein
VLEQTNLANRLRILRGSPSVEGQPTPEPLRRAAEPAATASEAVLRVDEYIGAGGYVVAEPLAAWRNAE